jgi:hypothetical protein
MVRPEDLPTEGQHQVTPSVDDIVASLAGLSVYADQMAIASKQWAANMASYNVADTTLHQDAAIAASGMGVLKQVVGILETVTPAIVAKLKASGVSVSAAESTCPITGAAVAAVQNFVSGLVAKLPV